MQNLHGSFPQGLASKKLVSIMYVDTARTEIVLHVAITEDPINNKGVLWIKKRAGFCLLYMLVLFH